MAPNYKLLSYNQEYLPESEFKISTGNRAFRYGDGFFETIHANGTQPQFFDDHFSRMILAADLLQLNLPLFFSSTFLKNRISGLLTRMKLFQAARVKVAVYRTGGGFYIPNNDSADILIEASFLGKGPYELNASGLKLGVYREMPKPMSVYSSIKATNAQAYIMAGIYARNKGFDDALLLNNQGNIVEATSSNIFALKGNKLYTPAVEQGCVAGVMRKQIIEIARKLKFSVYDDAAINLLDLTEMDELFLTNAISGIRYVAGFEKRRFFKRVVQKLTSELNRKANI